MRLLPGAERILEAVAGGRFDGREAYALRLQAERLALVAGFEELVCLDMVRCTPFD